MKRARPLMGTVVCIRARGAPEARFSRATQEAFELGSRLEARFSPFNDSSEIGGYNRDATRERSGHFDQVLSLGLEIERASRGAFSTRGPDGRLDLTGLAKGYIADRMAEAAQDGLGGDVNGEVNAGGDVRFFGRGPRRVSHLRSGSGATRRFECPREAVATSGFGATVEDRHSKTHYWLRPRFEVDHTVTVAAPTCAIADALTKVVLFGERVAAVECLRRWSAIALVLDVRGEVMDVIT